MFIREIWQKMDHYEYYNRNLELYVFSKTTAWDYEQERPGKGDIIKEDCRMYLHLYFNPEKHADDGKIFNQKMNALKEKLLGGHRVPEKRITIRNISQYRKHQPVESPLSSGRML